MAVLDRSDHSDMLRDSAVLSSRQGPYVPFALIGQSQRAIAEYASPCDLWVNAAALFSGIFAIFGRTDLRIGVSGAKLHEEIDFDA